MSDSSPVNDSLNRRMPLYSIARMRAFLAVLLLALAVASSAHADDTGVGRFILVAGSVGEGPHQHPTIIKIDTLTGQTWEFIVAEAPGSGGHATLTGWSRISDDIATEFRRFQSALPSPSPARSR